VGGGRAVTEEDKGTRMYKYLGWFGPRVNKEMVGKGLRLGGGKEVGDRGNRGRRV